MKTIKSLNHLLLISIASTIIYGCNSGGGSSASGVNLLNQTPHQVSILKAKLGSSYLNKGYGIAVESNGNLYVSMADQNIIQKIDATDSTVTTIAGNGNVGKPLSGQMANTQPLSLKVSRAVVSRDTYLKSPPTTSFYGSIAVDDKGNLYIADSGNNQIEKVDHTNHIMTVIAGGGNPKESPSTTAQKATSVSLSRPTGVAVDNKNNLLYIADNGNFEIEKVTLATKELKVIAGGGNNNPSTTSQSATTVSIMPYGITTDKTGNLYITDQMNNQVEKINTTSKNLIVIAGNGNAGVPTPGTATDSPLGGSIDGIAIDDNGNLYVADSSNNMVEKVANGNLSVVVGNGVAGYPYYSIPTKSSISKPHGVAVDGIGNLYVADTDNQIIEKYSINNNFYINFGAGFIQLSGPFQCVNDNVTGKSCGCLYDPQSGYTWYAGIKNGDLPDWLANGNALTAFNSKNHCGLQFHLPNITTPSWGTSPYMLQPILVETQSPGGSISSLVKLANLEDNSNSFHLLNNGFYADYGSSTPEDVYWLNDSSGLYTGSNTNFGWALLNYDSESASNRQMIAEPQMFMQDNNDILGKILLVSD